MEKGKRTISVFRAGRCVVDRFPIDEHVDCVQVKIVKNSFLAVQDSSISDIVCRSVCRSEPTNSQSLGSIKE